MFPYGWLTLLTIAACLPEPGMAQGPRLGVVPRPGQRVSVRIHESGSVLEGRVVDIGPDSLALETKAGPLALEASRLDQAKVATGRTRGVAKGAKIGAAVGGIIGTVVGIALVSDDPEDCSYCGLDAVASALAGLGGGMLLGGAVGSLTWVDVWSPAARPGSEATRFDGDLRPGDAVRWAGTRGRADGFVVGGQGTSVRVKRIANSDTVVALSSLERYVGDRNSTGKGFLYGAVGGAALGAVLALSDTEHEVTPASVAAASGLMAATGAVIGMIVGRNTRPRWSSVAPTTKAFSVTPIIRPDRLGVVARFAW